MKPKTLIVLYIVLVLTIATLGLIVSPAIPGTFIILLTLYYIFGSTKLRPLNVVKLIGMCLWLISGIVLIFSPGVNNWATFLLGIGTVVVSIGRLLDPTNSEKSSKKES